MKKRIVTFALYSNLGNNKIDFLVFCIILIELFQRNFDFKTKKLPRLKKFIKGNIFNNR